tara:strand:+ start:245 stop:691 length:447 start_codon:yes stop_codon:yes gene_type:complete
MDIKQLQKEIAEDEGIKLEVYNDHLGLPTCGIGHLIIEQDEEFGSEVGTKISQERCDQLFEQDINSVILDCKRLYPQFYTYPDEVKLILANMMFNLGRPRLSKFKKMRQAIIDGDWFEASVQMQDSKWYKQVPNRANRLIDRMKNVEE